MKLTRREKGAIVLLGAVAILAAVVWRPVSWQFLLHLLLRADAVSQETVDNLADAAADPSDVLQRLWNSHKIPHRHAVVNYLEKRSDAALPPGLQTILIEGCRDVDFEVRELSLRLLARQRFPELWVQSKGQLRDADPAVRLLGLDHLRTSGNPKLMPILIPLLDDPDPSVQASAGNLVQRWFGQDFGIRLSQALPQFTRSEPKQPEPDQLQALERGLRSAKAWWESHKGDLAENAVVPPMVVRALPAGDFALKDLDTKAVRLTDFRGKPLLLTFWDTVTPSCRTLITNLVQLQQREAGHLVILGVSLETTISERDHKHEHESKHAHHHSHIAPDLTHVRAQLRLFAEQSGIRYPVLIDADGLIAQRYTAEDLPTTVLIDSQGFVRRRFTGFRAAEALQAMLHEIEGEKVN
jgi:peroxiredoxin